MASKEFKSTFVVVGGGIAGVSCAEHLSMLCPDEAIILITATDLVKATCNLRNFGRNLQEFDVEEKSFSFLSDQNPNVTVVRSVVTSFNPEARYVVTEIGDKYFFKKLCICTGAKPNTLASNPYMVGIRDTDSVNQFQRRLSRAKRVVLVGNGGIALELVFEMSGCEVVWVIKDEAIGNTFFDKGAAVFFLPQLGASSSGTEGNGSTQPLVKLRAEGQKYEIVKNQGSQTCSFGTQSELLCGGALGPDWSSGLSLNGAGSSNEVQRKAHVEYKCELKQLLGPEEFRKTGLKDTSFPSAADLQSSMNCYKWPQYVELTNGKVYGCDLIVSATGVIPNTVPFTASAEFDVAEDGGIKVDSNFRTNISDVFAAGDVCTACWDASPHWFQMRLWSQARQMGVFAARSMFASLSNEQIDQDFSFELFAHVTHFFGYKVVLLGRYNGQDLANDYEILVRCTKDQEYVKVILREGKMCGALLIGETDLEETFENLILNEMDLSELKDILLDPDIDIEDYFD